MLLYWRFIGRKCPVLLLVLSITARCSLAADTMAGTTQHKDAHRPRATCLLCPSRRRRRRPTAGRNSAKVAEAFNDPKGIRARGHIVCVRPSRARAQVGDQAVTAVADGHEANARPQHWRVPTRRSAPGRLAARSHMGGCVEGRLVERVEWVDGVGVVVAVGWVREVH